MRKSCIRIFSFPPEAYLTMEEYLTDMLKQGWRLKWTTGIFAGFEKTEQSDLRYVVDPYAMTSPTLLGRFPKFRLQEYMENDWYGLGKSKGCYIFCTDNKEAKPPELENNMVDAIQKTCSFGSLLVAILLVALLFNCWTTPAIRYAILLTDIYIVLGCAAVFFVIYHLLNAIFHRKTQQVKSTKKLGFRYIFHDAMVFLFLLAATFLQTRHQTTMLTYLLLPISVVIIGSIFMMLAAMGTKTSQENNKRVIPVICIIGLVLLLLIPFSTYRLQQNSQKVGNIRQEELLSSADKLPVLRLAEVSKISEPATGAVRENNSILGNNLLFAEKSGDLSVFTNRTEMKNPLLAKYIFQYLYIQAQTDYDETFQEKTYMDTTYYQLEKANTYLLQQNATVYLFTVPGGTNSNEVMGLLLAD